MTKNRQTPGKSSAVKGKIRLQDVADALGVSKATVSLAINGSSLVADTTKKLVLEKIDELGYVYNRGAAGLSTGETRTIGLAVHDFTNPFFSRVCASIEAVLSLGGRMSFLCNTDESLERQTRFLNELGEHGADGLILCPALGTTEQDLQPLLKGSLPVVLISRGIEGANVDFVGNDDEQALLLATEHILSMGHTRVAMLGGSKQTTVGRGRRRGFLKALSNAGMKADDSLLIDCPANASGGSEGAKTVMALRDPPTALVCFNDLIALGALSFLHRSGLQPGKDISVIGCDGIEEGGRAYAGLSTVNVQKAAMGQEAADILLKRLADPKLPKQHIIMEPKLVIRTSCGGASV